MACNERRSIASSMTQPANDLFLALENQIETAIGNNF